MGTAEKKTKGLPAIAAVVALLSVVGTAQQASHTKGEDIFPASMTEVPELLLLPSDAMQSILSDTSSFGGDTPSSLTCQQQDITDATSDAVYRLLCVHVQLAPGSKDLLVIGTGDFRGDLTVPYWLFHNNGKTNTLVFKARAEQLKLLPQQHGTLRKISTLSVLKSEDGKQVTQIYSYDGKGYVQKAQLPPQ